MRVLGFLAMLPHALLTSSTFQFWSDDEAAWFLQHTGFQDLDSLRAFIDAAGLPASISRLQEELSDYEPQGLRPLSVLLASFEQGWLRFSSDPQPDQWTSEWSLVRAPHLN